MPHAPSISSSWKVNTDQLTISRKKQSVRPYSRWMFYKYHRHCGRNVNLARTFFHYIWNCCFRNGIFCTAASHGLWRGESCANEPLWQLLSTLTDFEMPHNLVTKSFLYLESARSMTMQLTAVTLTNSLIFGIRARKFTQLPRCTLSSASSVRTSFPHNLFT